jgi:hypothetical protein
LSTGVTSPFHSSTILYGFSGRGGESKTGKTKRSSRCYCFEAKKLEKKKRELRRSKEQKKRKRNLFIGSIST